MKTTQLHIARLLRARGYASVPGLGAFVTRRGSASINADGLVAPRCDVAFEQFDNTTPDQELTRSVVMADSLTETEARTSIADGVEEIRYMLSADGRAPISNAGALIRNDRGGIDFEISSQWNPCTAWLKPLDLKPLGEENIAAPAQTETAESHQNESFIRSMRRTASAAAAVAIFVFLAFIFSQLPIKQSHEKHYAAVMPSSLPTQPIVQESEPVQEMPLVLVFNTPADAASPVEESTDTASPVEEPTDATTSVEESASKPQPEQAMTQSLPRYCLVVASLASRAEAQKYLSHAPEGLEVLEKDGKYRIYSMADDSFDALQKRARLNGEYQRYPNAWICRR